MDDLEQLSRAAKAQRQRPLKVTMATIRGRQRDRMTVLCVGGAVVAILVVFGVIVAATRDVPPAPELTSASLPVPSTSSKGEPPANDLDGLFSAEIQERTPAGDPMTVLVTFHRPAAAPVMKGVLLGCLKASIANEPPGQDLMAAAFNEAGDSLHCMLIYSAKTNEITDIETWRATQRAGVGAANDPGRPAYSAGAGQGGGVYVHPYYKKNGTYVSGHTRRK